MVSSGSSKGRNSKERKGRVVVEKEVELTKLLDLGRSILDGELDLSNLSHLEYRPCQ